MAARSRKIRMGRIAGLLVLAAIVAPAPAFAIFPPVQPPPTINVIDPPIIVDPPIVIVGEPEPTPDINTPEPATIISGLIALGMGAGFARRKKKNEEMPA